MSDLHTRLRAHIDTGLAVARAAAEDSPPWHLNDWASRPYVGFMRLFTPAAIIAWLEGELEVLERHAPFDQSDWSAQRGSFIGLGCEHCQLTSNDGDPLYRDWPCPEIRSLAHRLGVSVET